MRWTQRYVNTLLNGSEYYDFELAAEGEGGGGRILFEDDPVIDINICDGLTSSVRWSESEKIMGKPFNLDFITATGLDNFFINDTEHPDAYDDGVIDTTIKKSYTGDEKFEFHQVGGWDTNINYGIVFDNNEPTCLAKLNGGFLQGFFKLHGYPYEMMPTRMRKGWTVDMVVRYPTEDPIIDFDDEGEAINPTLNYLYPENEGFIFYIGTRSEDKYWNGFTEGEEGEESILFDWENLIVTDERYARHYVPANPHLGGGANVNTDRPDGVSDYLFYHTSNKGYGFIPTTNERLDPLNPSINDGNVYGGFKIGYAYGGGTSMSANVGSPLNYSPLFTQGEDFLTADGKFYKGYYHYEPDHQPYGGRYFGDVSIPLRLKYPYKNIVDNAFGVRIRPDGHIGYRVLRMGNICQTEESKTKNITGGTIITYPTYSIEEAYSPSPIWTANDNGFVNITIVFSRYIELNECERLYSQYRKGTLTIYVNARPVLRQTNFEEIIPHELDQQKELQNGVPFNISWGGGTQGLLESVTFGGVDAADRGLMLEKTFAGTWMGSLHSFKMYIRPLYLPQIIHNFESRKIQYGMRGDFGGRYLFITKG